MAPEAEVPKAARARVIARRSRTAVAFGPGMALTTRDLRYTDGDTELTGHLVSDPGQHARPGILVIHGGGGLDDHARSQARRYAELGYVVFACDMFGDGVAGDRERIMAVLTSLRGDPSLLARRAQAGLSALLEAGAVNAPCAAIGFCFGGMAALTLARSGADLAGVVSMHGSLRTSRPAEAGVIRARVLVCHGALDPHVPMADVVTFVEEMNQAGVDYQVIVYGGAMHGFTHADAITGARPGVEYHARTDQRSFAAASAFLTECLAS